MFLPRQAPTEEDDMAWLDAEEDEIFAALRQEKFKHFSVMGSAERATLVQELGTPIPLSMLFLLTFPCSPERGG